MTDQAFLREVDEEYRRDQMVNIWRSYGRWILGAVVAVLIAFGVYLYLDHRSASSAAANGEIYDNAMRDLETEQAAKAAPVLDTLAKGSDGYAASALLVQASQLTKAKDVKGATAKYAQIANNAAFGQPFRDLALLRQTALEFDTLKPEAVIDRLKGLSAPTSDWFGTAGEMVAAAQLKLGKRAEAGKLYGQIAQGGDNVPESIRLRAVQLAGVLGVDVSQGQENKAQ